MDFRFCPGSHVPKSRVFGVLVPADGRLPGLPVSRENVLRALRAAGVGGASPTEEALSVAC